MKIETINKLCCPFDKSDLVLKTIVKDLEDRVIEGYLTCSHCSRLYPIIKGIPIMSPDEYREFSLEQPVVEKWKHELEGKTFNQFRLEK